MARMVVGVFSADADRVLDEVETVLFGGLTTTEQKALRSILLWTSGL